MQLCNISVQRGQRSVALNYDVVARRASTNHDTADLTEKRRQNTSYRQVAGMNLGFRLIGMWQGWEPAACGPIAAHGNI